LYQTNYGISLKDIGDIYLAEGDTGKAIENYEKALAVHQAIADKDTKDALAQGIVAYDLTKIGNALLANRETENALRRHERSIAILEKLHLTDAENVMVAHTLALSLEGFADALRAKKDFSKALTMYRRGLRIEEELNSNSANFEFQIKIARLYLKLAQTRHQSFDLKHKEDSFCQDIQADLQKSIGTFAEIQKRILLSPTNFGIFSTARQMSEIINCQKPVKSLQRVKMFHRIRVGFAGESFS
jgi:tetratricopeptide (TPR) repeat protein